MSKRNRDTSPLPTDLQDRKKAYQAHQHLEQPTEYELIAMLMNQLELQVVTPEDTWDIGPHTLTDDHGQDPSNVVFDQGDLIDPKVSEVSVRLRCVSGDRVGEWKSCPAQVTHKTPTAQLTDASTRQCSKATPNGARDRVDARPIDDESHALVAIPFLDFTRAVRESAEVLHPKLRDETARQELVRLMRASNAILDLTRDPHDSHDMHPLV